jgi:glycosyltransferase involved in cell wall biosynthesis
MRIEAIVPAFNEERTIAAVVSTLRAAPSVTRVLVVDDGSKDGTSRVAESAGAEVLTMNPNGGKGRAMVAGVRATTAPNVAFFDADLRGLQAHHVERLVRVAEQGYGMVCGLRDYGSIGNAFQLTGPIITGERVCSRELLLSVPESCWSGYAIETAMNDAASRRGDHVACVLLDGLGIVNKVSKTGWLKGTWDHAKMFMQIYKARQALKESCGTACATQ